MRFAVLAALLFALTVPGPGIAQELPKPKGIETTKGITRPKFDKHITEEYRFRTKYGTMYGTVIRPDPEAEENKALYTRGQGNQGPGVPVVLTLSPYNSIYQPVAGGPFVLKRSAQTFFPPRGYAYAQFDVVGTRESGGCYDYGGVRERKTAAAVVDFLGSRKWSNGNVGMIGGSYDGTTQFAAAVEEPKHLKAIIPQVAIDRWYDYAYGGGVRYFLNSERPTDEGFDTPFAFDFGFGIIPPTSDDAATLGVLEDRYFDPCDRIEHTRRGYDPDPVYDEFWKKRDYRRRASRVDVPTFIEGGWLDHNVKHWDSTRMFMALPDSTPKKLVMGQWAHSASQFKDAEDQRHAWFDYWLLGLETGVMDLPPVDSQLNTGNRTQLADWPPPGTRRVQVPLVAEKAPGVLSLQDTESPTYRDIDKRLTEDEALDGDCGARCLVFVSKPLPRSIRISGGPVLKLTAQSDAAATHYTPVLFRESADGSRSVISRGFLNTRNRNGLDTSQPVEPGKDYRAPVPIWDVDYRVPKGDRIGVAVLSSNVAWAIPEDDSAAQNTLKLDGASVLSLPLSQGASVFPDRAPTGQTPTGGNEGDEGVGDSGDERGGGADEGVGGVGGVADLDGGVTLPATGAGAALPGLLLLGIATRLFVHRRRG